MLVNQESYYPNKIDECLFFQDADLEHLPIMDEFQSIMAQKGYTEANKYMNQQDGIFGAFAGFFNAYENRLYNLQNYLLTQMNPNPFHYSATEPTDVSEGEYWID